MALGLAIVLVLLFCLWVCGQHLVAGGIPVCFSTFAVMLGLGETINMISLFAVLPILWRDC